MEPAFLAYLGRMLLHPSQRIQLGELRADALRDGGGRRKPGRAAMRSPADVAIVIRLARPEDKHALERLAGLDSASVPAAPILVAEADGALRSALSLHDGAVIADPFHRTVPLVALLTARAEQLRGERPGRRRWLSRLGLRAANRGGRLPDGGKPSRLSRRAGRAATDIAIRDRQAGV